MTEKEALQQALDLALRGWGRVSPNPLVGCVLLQGDTVVGEGWHAEYGGLHAERVALAAAGTRAPGATAVVTLEPCAHQGKQPPCTEALIAAGVRRVVVAAADPDPVARGGAERLRAAGVEVEIVASEEARRLNAPFFHRHADADRPWVALKLATSKEGWIGPADRARTQLSGPEAHAWVHWLRAGFDLIGVGGTTAVADDPALTVRGAVVPRVAPERVIFAGAELPASSAQFLSDGGPRTHLLFGHDLQGHLADLRHNGNFGALLVEGGGRLAAALVERGLVDRYYWIETPVVLGGSGIPAFAGHAGGGGAAPGRWVETERKSLGPDILHVMERA